MALRMSQCGAAAAIGLFVAVTPAMAADSAWVDNQDSHIRLVSAQSTVGDGASISVGLQIRLEPGWKTYWRDPGDAGLPPRLDWSGSRNVANAEIAWPAPKRFTAFGFDSFGYAEEIVFPIDIKLQRPGQPVAARVAVEYMVCAEICVPASAELALDLPAGPAASTAHAALINDYLHRLPADGPESIEAINVLKSGDDQVLEVVVRGETAFQAPDMFVEAPFPFRFGRPDVQLDDDGRRARLRLPVHASGTAQVLADQNLVLTLVDGKRAVEFKTKARPGS